ncbi:MAG: ABC transporter permease [Ignavibacteriae bacterium]|nr:ABC transporter permease [Ignavibacteriota bacterium]
MLNYALKNIAQAVSILIGVISITFILMFIMPGDPARMMLGQRSDEESVRSIREELGLNKPVYTQYIIFMSKALRGDLGVSYITNRNVSKTILEKLPATAVLGFTAIFISFIIGVFAGVISALKQNSFLDFLSMSVALFGISVPQFVLALLAVFIFSATLGWFPIAGYITDGWNHLILPALALALRPMAITARITRSSMLDVMTKDYIRTARAKGLSEFKVIYKHALRNALNPVITAASSSLAATLGGVFFIEYIFNWPGIGLLAMDSIMKLDFPMIQGTVMFSAVIFVLINLLVDIMYALLDPKVKIS